MLAGDIRGWKTELEEGFGYVVVVVKNFAFVDEVAGDGFYAEGSDAVGRLRWVAGLRAYLASNVGDGGGVDESVVKD